MTAVEQISQPPLGEQGEPCQSCGAPLASDQRYCLNCGERRGGPRVDYEHHLRANGEAASAPAGRRRGSGERDLTPLYALGGLFALGVMLAVGVLIGKGGNGGGTETASAPQTITVAGAGAGTAASAGAGQSKGASGSGSAFESDWPAGKTGYTVEIGTLDKAGSTPADVDAAKSQATSKGAKQVGALDSDQYASLPGGRYVIYSGVYDTKAEATKALKPLQSSFPDATVVRVAQSSGGGGGAAAATVASKGGGGGGGGGASSQPVPDTSQQVQSLQNSSGQSYENQVKHISKPISTGSGKPPPVDNKPPGGGSGGGTVIK